MRMDSRSERLGNGKYGGQKGGRTGGWAAKAADPRCAKRSRHYGERYRKEHFGQALQGPVLEAYIISIVQRIVVNVGSIRVTTSTTGPGLDLDSFTVTVDGTANQNISVNGTVTFSNLSPGNHTVELTGVGSNCPVSSENPQTVSVRAGDTTQAIFNVVCGSLGYVTTFTDSTVSVIETASNSVVATVSVGATAFDVAITPDGAFAYVTTLTDSTVSVIETASNSVVATVSVGETAYYVAITP